jgi:hypothetical protein
MFYETQTWTKDISPLLSDYESEAFGLGVCMIRTES